MFYILYFVALTAVSAILLVSFIKNYRELVCGRGTFALWCLFTSFYGLATVLFLLLLFRRTMSYM